ncbi:MAG: hypothetical protein AAF317_16450, partial [Pseudomonadota bacterium]
MQIDPEKPPEDQSAHQSCLTGIKELLRWTSEQLCWPRPGHRAPRAVSCCVNAGSDISDFVFFNTYQCFGFCFGAKTKVG